jgi:hypothetical protein
MVARHQDDQRLVVHHLVAQVEGRLGAQEGHVEPAAVTDEEEDRSSFSNSRSSEVEASTVNQ